MRTGWVDICGTSDWYTLDRRGAILRQQCYMWLIAGGAQRVSMYPVSIKGVLFSPKNEVVLLLNEREEWELPGGRLELGESSSACLAREILEELGLQVEVGAPIDTYLFEVVPGKHVFILTYRCTLAGSFTPSVSHEHKRIGLFPLGELPDNLPNGYRKSIEAVCRVS